jgi:hypothetical protein
VRRGVSFLPDLNLPTNLPPVPGAPHLDLLK